MKKRMIALALVSLLTLSLAACGSDAPENSGSEPAESTEPVHIGIVVKSLADQHWALVKAGAEAKAAELGVLVDVIGPNSESDVQAQVDMIDNLIGLQVDALCLAPSSQEAVLGSLQNAYDAGIPILTIDTDTTFDKRLSFIGTGNVAAAKMGGAAAAEVVGEGATCVILRGRLGDPTHDQREQGFREALEAAGVEIIEVKAADSDSEKAMNIMQDLLQVYDDIDLVCCTTDNNLFGAQRAVEAAGAPTLLMSFDGTSNACELILQGKVLGSVAQNPYAMGELAVENAIKAINGETIDARIDSGAEVIMADNAEQYLAELKEKAGQ
ncbi:MAG TPA: sugar ABC transporter substrate-binding protein [Anaerovoracaceae bacterium]|nr:sugar ABC transporter substrate-binding protein [Anaerovoracaceae bacterium]